MSVAVLFPGQGPAPTRPQIAFAGSQPKGDLLLKTAASACGLASVEDFHARGGRALDDTAALQPALVAMCLGVFARLEVPSDRVTFIGHSVGELMAIAASGSLALAAAVSIAAIRGRAMSDAAAERPGAMFALHPDHLDLARARGGPSVTVALDNGADEIVIGGDVEAITAVAAAVPGTRLRARGAWHTAAMEPARACLDQLLSRMSIDDPRGTVVSCVDAEPIDTTERVRACLGAAIVRPVRFREALEGAHRRGARTFVVVGPGATLRALVRRSLPRDVTVLATETDREVEVARRAIHEAS